MKLFIFNIIFWGLIQQSSASISQIPLKYSTLFEIYQGDGPIYLKLNRTVGNFKTQCIQIGGRPSKLSECDALLFFPHPLKNVGIASSTFFGFIKELEATESVKLATNQAAGSYLGVLNVRLPQDAKKYLESNIEAMLTFSYGDKFFNAEKGIDKLKIPVIYLNEFVESHPLARAEWIKAFGVLLGLEKRANAAFDKIEESYFKIRDESLKKLKNAKKIPQIIYGDINSQNVSIVKLDSFFYQAFKDLNVELLNGPSKIKSSLNLNSTKLEYIYQDLMKADFWINTNPLIFNQNNLNNKKIKGFKSYLNNKIYTLELNKSDRYWTMLSVRPDLILSDLYSIIWGDISKNLNFFKKL